MDPEAKEPPCPFPTVLPYIPNSLQLLRSIPDGVIAADMELLYEQVEKPRPNLGGGPPGRAD